MAPIVSTIEIDRPPAEVYAYVTNTANLPDWQESAIAARVEGEGSGSGPIRSVVTRQMGPRVIEHTIEVTKDPPGNWAVRGVDGPVRPTVDGKVEPLDDGTRSRVTISLEPKGHGIGLLLVPLVAKRQIAREMPGNMERLKGLIEGKAA